MLRRRPELMIEIRVFPWNWVWKPLFQGGDPWQSDHPNKGFSLTWLFLHIEGGLFVRTIVNSR